jgi:hypothetical protein
MRCFSSSVVPLQPPQPCMSFMRYGVVNSTAPSNHHKHSQSHQRWPRQHIWRCHCASYSSLPRVFHISNQSCHHILLHIILSALQDAISKNTYFSHQVERHICGRRFGGCLQDIMPRKPPSHHTRCSTSPADIMPCLSPLSHQRCKQPSRVLLNIRKHGCSVAALPRASGPLVALLPRSPSGI